MLKRTYGLIILLFVVIYYPVLIEEGLLENVSIETTEIWDEHGPIHIDGNKDLNNTAQKEGWVGNGSATNPYLIERLNITHDDYDLIVIRNTNMYFQIKNCLLEHYYNPYCPGCLFYGIQFENVSNVCIGRNSFVFSSLAIDLEECSEIIIANNRFELNLGSIVSKSSRNIQVINNTITQAWPIVPAFAKGAISLKYTENSSIVGNSLTEIHGNGMSLQSSWNSSIFNNTIINTGDSGVSLDTTRNVIVSQNHVLKSNKSGITLDSSELTQIINNTVIYNNYTGIMGQNCRGSAISRNNITVNGQYGIHLQSSNDMTITENDVSCNGDYGVYLTDGGNTSIKLNNFIQNKPKTPSQAFDSGKDNIFDHNYWDDWIASDTNMDGIIDFPYPLAGPINNSDPSPFVTAIVSYHMTSPYVLFPRDGETLAGVVTIKWSAAIDLEKHPLTYSVYYSANSGGTWILLAAGLNTTRLEWNTSNLADAATYAIKVTASCSEGLTTIAFSKNPFILDNNDPPLIELQFLRNNSIILPTTYIEFNISDRSLSHVWYHWDSQGNHSLFAPFVIKAINASGFHTLTIGAQDSWNCTTSKIYSFYILIYPADIILTYSPTKTAYSGESFEYSFTIANKEGIPLNITVLVYGSNDDLLQGNNTHFLLAPGENQTITLEIRPRHASLHQLELFLFQENLLIYYDILEFHVSPRWMSPTFLLPFLMIIVFFLLIAMVSGTSLFYIQDQLALDKLFWEQHTQLTQLIDQLTISKMEVDITKETEESGAKDPSSRPLGFSQYLQVSEPLDREVLKQQFYSLQNQIINGDRQNFYRLMNLLTQAEELLEDN